MLKKKKNILVLCENSVGLNNTTIQTESALKTNCTVVNQKFVLSLHYNGDGINLKQKIVKPNPITYAWEILQINFL